MAEKIFTVDRFLGLNESADSATELKLGEASVIENFNITDDYNLKTRPGIRRYLLDDKEQEHIEQIDVFHVGAKQVMVCLYEFNGYRYAIIVVDGKKCWTFSRGYVWKVIPYGGKVSLLWSKENPETDNEYNLRMADFTISNTGEVFETLSGVYDPLAITGRAPTGGGEIVENRNLLSDYYYVEFDADGAAVDYVLPEDVTEVVSVSVNGEGSALEELGGFNADTHAFVFKAAPEQGAKISCCCRFADGEHTAAKKRFLKMPYYESYNGATDTRMFFYGDGSNISYYTGTPAHGHGFYVPAMNELAVDFSDSQITAMVRHYSRLLVYKPDGVDAITYDPMTLADGKVIAGFYATPVNRNFGNDAMAQVQLVNNCPRSFTHSGIYEWRVSSGYQDERYAKRISQKVARTIAGADMTKVVTFDDEVSKTYYVFCNDEQGTVLVNRYDLEAWSIYKSQLTKGVVKAVIYNGKMIFLSNGELFTFDPEANFDAPVEKDGALARIGCVWESGYMAFGADYRRKHSSNLWVSMLPENNSRMSITVKTDRRDEYLEKMTGLPLLDFSNVNFANFSFLRSHAPKIKRIKIKVKKFVYYKLIFRVAHNADTAGDRATVLGYDQQVRYSSEVK